MVRAVRYFIYIYMVRQVTSHQMRQIWLDIQGTPNLARYIQDAPNLDLAIYKNL